MSRLVPIALSCSLLAFAACKPAGGGAAGGPAEPSTDEQKTLYAIGFWTSQRMSSFNIKPEELPYVFRGLQDGIAQKKPMVEMNQFGPKMNAMAQERAKGRLAEEKKAAVAFLEAAAKEAGAEKLPSGLIFKSIKEGTGEMPKATDKVKVHYHGTLRDGKVFDSSVERGQPASFALNAVIPCWTEGVQKIKVGGKAKLVCPSEIAYGDQGRPSIPPGAPLTFEVELLSIEASGPPAGAPAASSVPPPPAAGAHPH